MFLNAHGKKTQKGSFVRSVNDGTASGVGEVDVVPMINVVFLLLIFFMVVGVFRSAVDNNFVFWQKQIHCWYKRMQTPQLMTLYLSLD